MVGYGMAGDGHHITAPSPDGTGAMRSMRAALSNARLTSLDLDHINAHATSTPVGDGIEGRAVDNLIKEDGPRSEDRPLYVSSTKGATGKISSPRPQVGGICCNESLPIYTGHLLGAAGAIEAAFTILALRDGVVPATANLHK